MEPKPNTQIYKYLKEGAIMLLIVFLAISFFTPRFIEYSDYRLIHAIPFIINFSGIPLLVVCLLILNKGEFKPYFMIYGIISLFVATMASNMINSEVKSSQLQTNGVSSKAIIIDKKQTISRSGRYWQIKCSFTANKQRFETLYEIDPKNTCKLGDTLEILYNRDYPKMYELDTKPLYN
jgi:hypothetical protein